MVYNKNNDYATEARGYCTIALVQSISVAFEIGVLHENIA